MYFVSGLTFIFLVVASLLIYEGVYLQYKPLSNLINIDEIEKVDLKYYDDELALKYSFCTDYFETATMAIDEMFRQVGGLQISEDGLLKKGVIVRVLILPGHIEDAKNIINYLYKTFGDSIIISIMNQFTPVNKCKYDNLNRKVTDDEYNEVIENPFRGSKSKVLRLEENKIKLITDLPIISYTMTYLSNSSPIILVDLPNGLTINNESKKSTTIETSESIHREILDKAVQLAIQSKTLLKSST